MTHSWKDCFLVFISISDSTNSSCTERTQHVHTCTLSIQYSNARNQDKREQHKKGKINNNYKVQYLQTEQLVVNGRPSE